MRLRLTDTRISAATAAKKTRKLTDGKGLSLEITPTGSRLWRYRYRIDGKENVYAAGEYFQPPIGETEAQTQARIASGLMTLSEARIALETWRAMVRRGAHPARERKTAKLRLASENANTFEAVSREWMHRRVGNWSAYYAKQVKNCLESDVFPEIGALPMRAVTAAHLLRIVQKVEKRGAETVAILIRQWCSQVFRYAVATLRAETDHAAAIRGAVERPPVQHHRPLDRSDLPGFLKVLEAYGGYRTTSIALRLLLLTFVRPGELRGAQWGEFDLDNAVWRIPAERMKMREEHVVPLSAPAVELLRELHRLTGGQLWLFPNYRRPKTYMTITTLNRALERMGYGGRFSSHGFRATASTMLNEMGYRPDVIERQLAHRERNKSRASYNRAEYLDERRQMMHAWADIVLAPSTVVPGRFQRAG